MSPRPLTAAVLLSLALGTPVPAGEAPAGRKALSARTPQAWTAKEALAAFARGRHDRYLQYVALQLARAEELPSEEIERLAPGAPRASWPGSHSSTWPHPTGGSTSIAAGRGPICTCAATRSRP